MNGAFSAAAKTGSAPFTSLIFEKTDRIAIVTFDTPKRLNAINAARLDEMEAVLTDLESGGDVGALIITGGEGKAFCVGLDLDLLDRAFNDLDYFEAVVRRVDGIITRLEALPFPTIAAINGITRAGGFEFSMGCDFVIVADDAQYGDAHTDSGVLPAAATLRLARRVGEQRAKEMVWTSRWYVGAEAVDAGLALKSVPRDRLRAEAIAFAKTMTDKPQAVIGASKRVFQQGRDLSLRDGIEMELQNFMHYLRSERYGREGYTAYREKTPAVLEEGMSVPGHTKNTSWHAQRADAWVPVQRLAARLGQRISSRIRAATVVGCVLLSATAMPVQAADDADAASAPATLVTACAALMKQNFFDIPDAPTSLLSTAIVAATDSVPAYCRVVGTIAPQVGFEVGLPLANWNGRLMMQGCGGTCGVRSLAGCEDMLARNFTVAFADMGHTGRPLLGGLWAHGNLPAVVDFGYRATHVTLVAAKVIQEAFYGRPAAYSYFRGCSTGGRQAMVEAERFPGDFDGIVSIAPPLDETGVTAMHLAWTTRATTARDGRKVIDADDVRRVHAAVLAACDGLDGVRDGVVGNPSACRWSVTDLRCRPGTAGVAAVDGAPCLSDEKVDAFRKIYDGVRDGKGRRIYPGGLLPGSELGWLDYFVSTTDQPAHLLDPNWIVGEFFRYLAFWDTPGSFGVFDFDYDRDVGRLGLMEAFYSATNPDLRRFKARSAKLILVGGMADPLIPVPSLIDYYQTVTALMGGTAQTRDFFRLFLVPGMEHCVGGVGPDAIDYLGALQAWVERDQAPDALMGAHLPRPQSMLRYARHPLAAGAAEWSRPVFEYPASAVFTGRGDWHDAANWKRGAGPR